MRQADNVISYRKVLEDFRKELAEFEAEIMELADPEKPLTLKALMEQLDIIEQAYYEFLVKRIAQLERWAAVDEGREQ